ncbi:M20/M25/M40 family metallo-hydrolase [Saccharolobus solfataricus]|uniref:Deacetylase, putative n=3 Tax=Saccharolobus solfataricus TaxID=2287 RepID=Q97V97_SACS2|nr:M20/M25/M40 family metallo-hydrolase [Saccharolobus solfataricus]4MMO_A Chain A, Sso-CP2 metallo-carboxypetidase [Saccharolobus solfataricus P2]4MMO_B Chain B, Sso-CP2 metallo-carboxypetidase [Saccharolobus solfataricus P2]AAK42848.1 Deacetylase, putative [Saccharolobus solfataricus P2]AKA72939.1 M20/M25/M40 family metallo-hydrolase [Saccharolobus solfataricus]AKA75638.1 M20/M25/M40 family metallo-hydrolase [Saccharolobus solfataricus]AKA78331.1 M20/M25/M40 family metallo-hydrolase [Saccha
MDEELYTLIEFLKKPSISATGEGIDETANYLKETVEKLLGVKANLEKTKGHPVVYAEINVNAKKTLLIYNHYDVQPVDPISEWKRAPFSATIENDRIYARGASDNKGTLMARLFAIKHLLDKNELNVNVKLLYEGEEEIGSVNLEDYIEKNTNKLKADSVIMEGAGLDPKGRPQIVLGVKGLLYVELVLDYGTKDLHSSNAPLVRNPCIDLAKIISTLVDMGGRVLIEGFYDDVRELTEEERELIKKYDIDVEELKKALGFKELKYNEKEKIAEALLTYPTCNVDGFECGYTGKGSKTIVPHRAFAKLDFRLVPNQDPYKVFELLKKHLQKAGFNGEILAHGFEYPVRTSVNSTVVKAMIESAKKVYGTEPQVIPNSAGTQPMGLFVYKLGIRDAVSAIGAGGYYSNAHAPNENIKIDDYYKAIKHTEEFLKLYPIL